MPFPKVTLAAVVSWDGKYLPPGRRPFWVTSNWPRPAGDYSAILVGANAWLQYRRLSGKKSDRVLLAAKPAITTLFFQAGLIDEIVLCRRPQIGGSASPICLPFETPDGRRIQFRLARWKEEKGLLFAFYRKAKSSHYRTA